MKKVIYGTVLVAALAALWIFLINPPVVTDHAVSRTLSLTLRLPEGYEFTEGAPFALTWQAESAAKATSVPVKVRNFDPTASPYKLVLMLPPGSAAVALHARLYYCDKTSRMCFQGDFETRVPLAAGSPSEISHFWEITPQETPGLGTRP